MDPGTKHGERGLFHADRPGPASHYGRYMYPLVTRAKNPVEIDFAGKAYGQRRLGRGVAEMLIGILKRRGKQAMIC